MLRERLSIEEIRAVMPAVQHSAYLNTGTYGPLPAAAHEAIIARQQADYAHGRSGAGGWETMLAAKNDLRRDLGRLLGARPEEIAITLGTTYGMNYAIWGINWREGDELVVTDLEHIGGLATGYVLQHRLGVRVRFAACTDPARATDAVRAQLSPRTRAVAFSHVAWSTGAVFPVADIAAAAHSMDALAICDAAQSAGAIAVDVQALGVDAYAAPGQKWLCGPGATGALYVASAALDRLGPSFASGGTFAHFDELGDFAVHEDARRFEMGAGNAPVLMGFRAAITWMVNEIDLPWAHARTIALADHARTRLASVAGVTVLTPTGTGSGLTTFTFAGWEPMAVVEELQDRGVIVRSLKRPAALRASTGFYNNEDDIERLVAALREVRALTPHPPRTVMPG